MDGQAALNTVVERIIHAESDGDPNPKKKRSSATGAAQFFDGTWLEMLRVHRPDLIEARSEKDILDLRRDPELAREIATRFVEQNVGANPFLGDFTVTDLKSWADRKLRGPGFSPVDQANAN